LVVVVLERNGCERGEEAWPGSTATTALVAAGGGVMQYGERIGRHLLSTIMMDKDNMESSFKK
jgi:hypothetical protein